MKAIEFEAIFFGLSIFAATMAFGNFERKDISSRSFQDMTCKPFNMNGLANYCENDLVACIKTESLSCWEKIKRK